MHGYAKTLGFEHRSLGDATQVDSFEDVASGIRVMLPIIFFMAVGSLRLDVLAASFDG